MRTPQSPICPICSSTFEMKHVDFAEPFRCPVCNGYLCVPRSWLTFSAVRALAVATLLCFLMGASGANLLIAVGLTWLPIAFLLLFWTRHYAPPRLKPCTPPDGYSGPFGLGRDES